MNPKDIKESTNLKKYRKLWSLALKCSGYNSKITTEMEHFIKENFLDETFTLTKADGTIKELPMFVTNKPRKGGSAILFDPRADAEFKSRHGDKIAQKAQELEEKCDFISLRNLACLLKLYSSSNDALYDLIDREALEDTFETVDENGNKVELYIFKHQTNRMNKTYFSAHKDGIPTFIRNHRESLRKIGVPVDEYNNDALSRPEEGILTPRLIVELLQIKNIGPEAVKKFYHLLENNFSKINVKENDTGLVRPLFQRRWYRSEIFCLYPDDMPSFVFKAQKQLKKLGIPTNVLNHYLFKEELHKKTDKMIPISLYLRSYLRSNWLTKLGLEIKEKHLSDTYIAQDREGHLEEKPIFLKVRNSYNELGNYVFASKEAMFAFTRKNKELLLSHGVTLYRYNNLLREENEQIIPQDPAVSVSELVQSRIISPDKATLVASYIDNTFLSSPLKNGAIDEKPFGYLKRDERKGFLKCYLLKEGLLKFLKRFKKELRIQESVIEAIAAGKTIQPKDKNHLSLSELLNLMGRNERITKELKQFSLTHVQDTFKTKEGEEKDIFSFAQSKNSNITLFIDIEAIPTFLTRYAMDLKQFGITSQHIHNTLLKLHKNPNLITEIQHKRQRILMMRKQRKETKRA